MKVTKDNKIQKLIVIGDRVLIRPSKENQKTSGGIYLPPGVKENAMILSGEVIKVGPGYPIPVIHDESEKWKYSEEQIKYIPLQVQEGDKAIFLEKDAFEIKYDDEKYYIVPQHAILIIEREENLF